MLGVAFLQAAAQLKVGGGRPSTLDDFEEVSLAKLLPDEKKNLVHCTTEKEGPDFGRGFPHFSRNLEHLKANIHQQVL